MRSVLRRAVVSVLCFATLYVVCVGVAWLRVALGDSTPSSSEGQVGRGRLIAGKPMPPSGEGYKTYSYFLSALGRQYVHEAVRTTLQSAFARVAAEEPGRVFQLAETSWRTGGRFRPHRTHQNGLSADILMPVLDAENRPAQLCTWPWQAFGYRYEFDKLGRDGELHIAFSTVARLLIALDEEAARNGLRIELIIIAPEYVPLLFTTDSARRLESLRSHIVKKPVWIRHDEHFHVDFALAGR